MNNKKHNQIIYLNISKMSNKGVYLVLHIIRILFNITKINIHFFLWMEFILNVN